MDKPPKKNSLMSYPITKAPQKSILSTLPKHTNILQVIYNNQDVTPNPISPNMYRGGKERQITIFDIQKDSSTITHATSFSSRMIKSESTIFRHGTDAMTLTKRGESIYTTFTSIDAVEDLLSQDEEGAENISEVETEGTLAPLKEIPDMPPYITLTLYETETFFILDLPSSTEEKDSPAGALVEEDNKLYEYLTEGKGKNRKVVDNEMQTIPTLLKSREVEGKRYYHSNVHAFASLWDMYDTFIKSNEAKPEKTFKRKSSSFTSIDSLSITKEDKEIRRLFKTPKFQEALCVMQRILANNVYNEQQKRFRGLKDPDPFRENIEFNYKLNLLWTFANEDTKGHCVTALKVNPINKDIIAVGYGKFLYEDEATGMVLIWNIKNPVQPERDYRFPVSVTSIDFSKQNPNLLAIGFYNGDLKVIDISNRDIAVVGINNKSLSQIFEPIWQICWYIDHDYYKGKEFMAATCQDGRICKFCINHQTLSMDYSQMMRTPNAEGKLKGIETLRKCPMKAVPLSRHSPALIYTPHPTDPNIYYVGTGEGVIHTCSKNYYHQHLDLFIAHDGPMYTLEYSPFCKKVFITCGDDWAIRVWASGIAEPLFDIKKKAAGVQGVTWSPSHSSIIASISGMEIYIWDLQRKTYDSQSSTISPSKSRNTLVQFTHDGRCLMVADINGHVHMFSLEDMPFPAYFPENLLEESIRRALITRPDLLNKLDKLGSLSYSTT